MATETVNWVGVYLSGRYDVTAQLGAGGMGVVYKARDRRLEADVVVKVPHPGVARDPEFARRFQREVGALVRLAHPHIVGVLDLGSHDGLPFAVLQFLPGGNLRQRQGRDRAPAAGLRGWLPQVAAALDFVHSHRCIHRDVKPDNILFDRQGNAFLSDFGVVKVLASEEAKRRPTVLTGAGMVLGTPQFMAPELLLGTALDGRVDQYALAVTVYQTLTGSYPFDGPTAPVIFEKQINQPAPPLPQGPAALDGVLGKALAKNPRDRFPTCAAFAQAVQKAVAGPPAETKTSRGTPARTSTVVAAQIPTAARAVVDTPRATRTARDDARPRRPHRRRSLRAAGVVVLLVGAALAAGAVLVQRRGNPTQEEQAPPVVAQAAPPAPTTKKEATPPPPVPPSPPVAAPQTPQVPPNRGTVPAAALEPVVFKNSLGMELVKVPRGKFRMGGGGGKWGDKEMEIPYDFYLGMYEVTQEEWGRVIKGANPSYFSRMGGGKEAVKDIRHEDLQRFPVEGVSWDDAQVFLQAINAGEKAGDWIYRLPKEAEWEYACRGGPSSDLSQYAFSFYLDRPANQLLPGQANFDKTLNRTCKVGSYQPNRLGLCDMHGNVWEWCHDADRTGEGTPGRVYRGGGWDRPAGECRVLGRGTAEPSRRYHNVGLRVARVPAGKEESPPPPKKEDPPALTKEEPPPAPKKDEPPPVQKPPEAGPPVEATKPVGRAPEGQTFDRHRQPVCAVVAAPDGKSVFTAGSGPARPVAPPGVALPLPLPPAAATTATGGTTSSTSSSTTTSTTTNTTIISSSSSSTTTSSTSSSGTGNGDAGPLAAGRPGWASTVLRWDVNTLAPNLLLEDPGEVRTLAVDADGGRLLTGGPREHLTLWNARTGKPITRLALVDTMGDVGSVAFAPGPRSVLAASGGGKVVLWNLNTGKPVWARSPGNFTTGVAFSPTGKSLLSCGEDGVIRVWNVEKGTEGKPFLGHEDIVWQVAFLPDGVRFVSCSGGKRTPAGIQPGDDNTVRVWDGRTGSQAGAPLRGHKGMVRCVAVSPDGKRVVSGDSEGSVRLWDLAAGAEVRNWVGHKSPVRGVAFLPDGRVLSCSDDTTVRLWTPPPAGDKP